MQAMATTEDTVQTQIRIPRALWERVKAAADADRRSANFMVLEALGAMFPAPGAAKKSRKKTVASATARD